MAQLIDVVLSRVGGFSRRFPTESIDLGHDVMITPVSVEAARYIADMCEPHRLRTPPHDMTDPVRFAFIRQSGDSMPSQFDSDGRLVAALAVSRLVQPHSTGFELSARLTCTDGLDSIVEAVTGPFKGPAAFAYIPLGEQDGITHAGAKSAGTLFSAYWDGRNELPERVKRSLWRIEYAARSEYLEIRFLFLVSAIEALLKTDRHGATKQFRERSVQLASRYAGVVWAGDDADRAYDLRSEMSHGHKVSMADPDLPLYVRLEKLARFAVIDAITTRVFAEVFASDATIRTHFPVA